MIINNSTVVGVPFKQNLLSGYHSQGANPLNDLIKLSLFFVLGDKADGVNAGINSPFTNPLVDLSGNADVTLQGFAQTPESGYSLETNGDKSFVMLTSDGANDIGLVSAGSAPNPTGQQDFAQLIVFKPDDTNTRFYGLTRNSDSGDDVQYGLAVINSTQIGYFVGNTQQLVDAYQLTSLQWVLYGRINGERFLIRNNTEMHTGAYANSIASQPNAQLNCVSASVDGTVKAGFADGDLGAVAFFYKGDNPLDKARIVSYCKKFVCKQYGLTCDIAYNNLKSASSFMLFAKAPRGTAKSASILNSESTQPLDLVSNNQINMFGFDYTATSGYADTDINGLNVVGIRPNGTSNYATFTKTDAINITSNLDTFSISFLVKTGATLSPEYLFYVGDGPNVSDVQYSIRLAADGSVRGGSTSGERYLTQPGSVTTNSVYDVRIYNTNNQIKCVMNKVTTLNSPNNATYTPKTNATLFAKYESPTTKSFWFRNTLMYLAMSRKPESEIKPLIDAFVLEQFGVS